MVDATWRASRRGVLRGRHAAASRPSGAGKSISALIWASVSRPLNDGIALREALHDEGARGPRSTRGCTRRRVLPFSILAAAVFSSSRFGPIVPLDFAGPKVWQPAQPAAVKICVAGLRLGQARRGERARVLARRAGGVAHVGGHVAGVLALHQACRHHAVASAGAGSACARCPRPCRGRCRPGARPGRRCRGWGPACPACRRAPACGRSRTSRRTAPCRSRGRARCGRRRRSGSAIATRAERPATVLRVRLTGREHYPLGRGRRRADPAQPRSRPRATLSQEYRRAASAASAARASLALGGVQLEPGHELGGDLLDRVRARPRRTAAAAGARAARAPASAVTSAMPEWLGGQRQRAAGGRLGGDHAERLREGARASPGPRRRAAGRAGRRARAGR